jgi:hypothetical protein
VIRDQIVENKTTYQLFVGPSEPPIVKKRQTYSSLYGKKLVGAPEKVRIQNDLDDEKPKEYENFIIGIDDEGNPVTFTCNPEVLADFFGKNPGNPNFVTPVFFKKEVLSKYYSQPGKYSVEDGQLNCGSLWTLRLDNNHPRYVIVFLGDLGQTLGEKEQQYWGSFNVPPDGAISEVSHKRGVMAEFADPTEKHLLFKQEFKEFQRRWESAFGWCFFLPLSNDDSHFFAALRIPLTGDQAEFDAQILALAKILVDSLNEEELSRNASREAQGSISILEAFFDARGVANWKSHIDFLRDLQALRSSGSAHRKGSRYKKVAAVWGIGQRDLREICTAIFGSAIQLIHFLNDALLCHE